MGVRIFLISSTGHRENVRLFVYMICNYHAGPLTPLLTFMFSAFYRYCNRDVGTDSVNIFCLLHYLSWRTFCEEVNRGPFFVIVIDKNYEKNVSEDCELRRVRDFFNQSRINKFYLQELESLHEPLPHPFVHLLFCLP